MNKRHWNTVTVDGGHPDRLVRELVEDSYDLVVAGLPKAERHRLHRARAVGDQPGRHPHRLSQHYQRL
ncbi:MmcQ/YjbR family DNA-binding protein, partial [Methylobacterium crusticola]|uniref:MmcQ/YjbR family DNA-binding protein n=1 Tax=Methylobacterium crusticola TaxID=1697972 RepID=UPI001EE196E5